MLLPIYFTRLRQVKSTFSLFSHVRHKTDQQLKGTTSSFPNHLYDAYLEIIPHYFATKKIGKNIANNNVKKTKKRLMEPHPKVIDGKTIADKIRKELTNEVKNFVLDGNPPPCIAVVLVGQRKDSMTYVRMKERACKEIGISFIKKELDQNSTEQEIITTVQELNEVPWVDGILVQMPLPPYVNSQNVLKTVDIEKDVDGFHPYHVGNLALRGHTPHFISCTPKGCIELLKREGISIHGKHAVVVGRSNIVGIPLSLLLLKEDATVTTCHSKTQNLDKVVATGDLVFAAVGSPLMIKKEWIKPGAVCIDIGVNAVDDPNDKRGYRLVGDIDYDNVIEVASRITPVPGGVGPMTVAMLTQNTFESAKRRKNRKI